MPDLPAPNTPEYKAVTYEWRAQPTFTESMINNNKETTTMNTTAQLAEIRDIVVGGLESADWTTSEINELITEVNDETNAGWKLIAEERTLYITYSVTVEVEDVLIEDPENIDVYDLDLWDFTDVYSDNTNVVSSSYEMVEVAS